MSAKSLDLRRSWRGMDYSDDLARDFRDLDFVDVAWPPVDMAWDWRAADAFEGSSSTEGVLLRRRFEATASPGRRSWLTFEGLCDQAGVWVDGSYIGDIDGYFAPHSFEVTDALAASHEHVMALEVPPSPTPRTTKNGDDSCVELHETGPVRFNRIKVLCTEASPERAVLSIRAELDVLASSEVSVKTTVTDTSGAVIGGNAFTRGVSAGQNRLRWTVLVEEPGLWWPWQLGDRPLFDVAVDVSENQNPDETSDSVLRRTGFRHVTYEGGRFAVNGDRIFVKGIGGCHTREELLDVRAAGANAVVCDMVESSRLYEAADELGMLVLQRVPGTALDGKAEAVARLARQAAELLGHHPSLALWMRGRHKRRPWPPSELLETQRRAIDRADSSRPTLTIPPPSGARSVSRRHPLINLAVHSEEVVENIDLIRKAKYRPATGFFIDSGGTAGTALEEGVLDLVRPIAEPRRPSSGNEATIDILVVSDLVSPITDGILTATIEGPEETLSWSWSGEVEADSTAFIGTISVPLAAVRHELVVALDMTFDGGRQATRRVRCRIDM